MQDTLTKHQEKKAKKVFFSVAKTTGLGIGLIILAYIAPFISESINGEALRRVFFKYAVIIMIYAVIMVGTYMFFRKQIFPLHIAMQWVILPTVAIMFLMDGYNAIVNRGDSAKAYLEKARLEAATVADKEVNKWGLKEMVVDE